MHHADMIGWDRALAVISALLVAVGCQGQRIQRAAYTEPQDSTFPTSARLEQIAGRPASESERASVTVVTSEYEVIGETPQSWADEAPEGDALGRILSQHLPTKQHRATRAGQCVAQALAHFVLTKDGSPGIDLQTYMMGRCRAAWANLSWSAIRFSTPDQSTVADVIREAEPALASKIREVATPNETPIDYGLAMARSGTEVIFLLARGAKAIVLTAVDRVANGDRFTVRGQLLGRAGSVGALMNQGPYGVVECEMDPVVRLPDFYAVCPARRGDDEAWIELAAFPPDRYLGQSVAHVLVSPTGEPPKRYRAPRLRKTPGRLDSGHDLRARVLTAVSGFREQAGLPPLTIEVQQSEVANGLVPHYFSASADAASLREQISLGLRAGWAVEGSVQYGLFTSGATSGTDDASFLAASLVTRPFGRKALLDPSVRSVGPVGRTGTTLRAAIAFVDSRSAWTASSSPCGAPPRVDGRGVADLGEADLKRVCGRRRAARGSSGAAGTESDGAAVSENDALGEGRRVSGTTITMRKDVAGEREETVG